MKFVSIQLCQSQILSFNLVFYLEKKGVCIICVDTKLTFSVDNVKFTSSEKKNS